VARGALRRPFDGHIMNFEPRSVLLRGFVLSEFLRGFILFAIFLALSFWFHETI
jgi:hypothetical protein